MFLMMMLLEMVMIIISSIIIIIVIFIITTNIVCLLFVIILNTHASHKPERWIAQKEIISGNGWQCINYWEWLELSE